MKLLRKPGSTSEIWQIFIRDSSSTTGAGLTGLTNASAGLTAYYHRDTDTTATAISLVTMTVGTFTSSGFKEIDSTNMPGWYQFCPPNAALASGAKSCGFLLKGATNMAPLPIEADLDGQVDVALWNGTAVPAPATAGVPDVNAKAINNVATTSVTTINANQGTTQPLNFTGTGASALVKVDAIDINSVAASSVTTIGANIGTTQPVNFTGTGASALVKSDMVDIAGAAVSTSTAQIGVNVIQSAGTTVHNSDGTLASATASTVTFPTTDSAGNTIPDDARYQYTIIQIVAGTGIGQVVALTTKSGVRTFNILSGTCPVLLDATSQYDVVGSWRSELELWLGSAPNALISGRVDSNAQATAASLSYNLTGNITGNLSGSVGSVTGAVGSVTGNVGGNVTGSVGSIASGGIANASFAADTGKVTVRSGTAQAGAATTITLDAGASATTNYYINDIIYLTGGTGVGQARFCTAYNGTTKVATVQSAWATNPDATTTFAIIPFDSIPGATAPTAAQVATAVWQDLTAGSDFGTAGSIGALLKTDIDATISSRLASSSYTTPPTAAANATAVWTDLLASSDFSTASSIGALLKTDIDAAISSRGTGTALTATQVENAVWDGLTASHATAGSFGLLVKTDLDAAISSRMATFTLPTNFASLAITAGGAVTAGTVSDKTGYALSSAGLDSVTIETSLNARQALSIIASASAGVLAGAATTTVTIAGAGVPATNRVTATCDSSGNRSAVTLNPPA